MLRLSVCLALAGGFLPAQDPDFVAVRTPIPFVTHSHEMIAADFDADGVQDLLWFSRDGVLLARSAGGTGPAGFTRVVRADRWAFSRSGAVGDFNGDGRLDVFAADQFDPRYPLRAAVLLQRPDGSFLERTAPDVGRLQTHCVAVGDVDGDGHLDVYLGQTSTTGNWDRLLLGDGQGGFTDASARLPNRPTDTRAVRLVDYDQDGDLDVIKANRSTANAIYRNDGRGSFQDVIGLPSSTEPTVSLDVGDFDGDGHLDIVFGNFGSTGSVELLRNDGTQRYQRVALPQTVASQHVRFADVDGDNDLDIVSASESGAHVFRNLGGTAGFAAVASPFPASTGMDHFALIDLDGDGDDDLVVPQGAMACRPLYNRGRGGFEPWPRQRRIGGAAAVGVADLDGDGVPEIATFGADLAAPNQPALRILSNDGGGQFVSERVLPSVASADVIYFVDVDDDGDQDMFVGGFQVLQLFENDGSGGFGAPVSVPQPSSGTVHDIRAEDVDGDGDLDLLILHRPERSSSRHYFYRNQGGKFSLVPGSHYWVGMVGITSGDFDFDGDVDFVLHGTYRDRGGMILLDNQGGFRFTETRLGSSTSIAAVRAVDVDEDGDQDLVYASHGKVQFYENTRTGGLVPGFTPVGVPGWAITGLVTGDIDGDGHVDLCVFQSPYTRQNIYAGADGYLLGDGKGGFSIQPGSVLSQGHLMPLHAGLADLDGDGDLDLWRGNEDGLRIEMFDQRQVSWRIPPRLGRRFELDITGFPGTGWLLGFGTTPARVEVPGLGTLRLAPPIVVGQRGSFDAAGRRKLGFGIPHDPQLLSLNLGVQVLHLRSGRLGNLETLPVQRD